MTPKAKNCSLVLGRNLVKVPGLFAHCTGKHVTSDPSQQVPAISHQAQALVSVPCRPVVDVQTDGAERELLGLLSQKLGEDPRDIRKPPGRGQSAVFVRFGCWTPPEGPLFDQNHFFFNAPPT